jgi:hypothetical protein
MFGKGGEDRHGKKTGRRNGRHSSWLTAPGPFLCRNNRQSAWFSAARRCPMPETARHRETEISNNQPRRRTGRKAMEWFGRTTSIAGVQIPNWGIVLGAAVIVILFIYSAFIH